MKAHFNIKISCSAARMTKTFPGGKRQACIVRHDGDPDVMETFGIKYDEIPYALSVVGSNPHSAWTRKYCQLIIGGYRCDYQGFWMEFNR